MISITTKSPYALKALTELGRTGDAGPVPIGELARRRDIPVQFLEQLFATLRRAGVLKSQRGVKGGYSFARDPSAHHRARDRRAPRRPARPRRRGHLRRRRRRRPHRPRAHDGRRRRRARGPRGRRGDVLHLTRPAKCLQIAGFDFGFGHGLAMECGRTRGLAAPTAFRSGCRSDAQAASGLAMDAPHVEGRLLTAAEVAARLGYSERYVWRLGREGVLPRVKLPGRKYVRFCEADVQRLIEHEPRRIAATRAAGALPRGRRRRRACRAGSDAPLGLGPMRGSLRLRHQSGCKAGRARQEPRRAGMQLLAGGAGADRDRQSPPRAPAARLAHGRPRRLRGAARGAAWAGADGAERRSPAVS